MWTRRHLAVALAAAIVASLSPGALHADGDINLSGATRITLPAAGNEAVAFKTPDGKDGWVVRLSNETIPTPAYAGGRVYSGSGMSSRLFTAFDALSGKILWQRTTTDNGPTSPVAQDRYISYNTESCHTETRDSLSGDLVWSEVTGGSLMTQPVIANDMLIIPHPTMQRKAEMSDDAFRMLGVDLQTGKHHWDANMTGDVLGAPVAAGRNVCFTCTDGRVFCLGAQSGGSSWHVVANATSAPVIVGDTLAITTEEAHTFGGATVSIRRYAMEDGDLKDQTPLAPTNVDTAVVASRQLARAQWDYQGPKIAARGKQLFNAPGKTVNSVDIETGKQLWRDNVMGDGLTNSANALTPPALGKANLYLGSQRGHIVALRQSDGSLAFAYNVGQPLASQPILAEGNLYFGTASGLLVCIKLQDADIKDWTAWGGNAQHNKVD